MNFSKEDILKILDGIRLTCTVQVPRLSLREIESYIQKESHATAPKRKRYKRLRFIHSDTDDDDDACSDSRLPSFSVNDNDSSSSSVVLKPLPINVIKDTCDESIKLKKNIQLKRKHVCQEIKVPKKVKFVQNKTDSDNIDNDVTDSFQTAQCVHNKVTVNYNLSAEKSDENKSLPNHIKSNVTNTKLTDVSSVKVNLDAITEINSKRKCKGEQINYPKNKANANKNKIQDVMPEITNSDENIKIKSANNYNFSQDIIILDDCEQINYSQNKANANKNKIQDVMPEITNSDENIKTKTANNYNFSQDIINLDDSDSDVEFIDMPFNNATADGNHDGNLHNASHENEKNIINENTNILGKVLSLDNVKSINGSVVKEVQSAVLTVSPCKKGSPRKIQRTDCNELKTKLYNNNSEKKGDVSQKSIPQISKSHISNSPKQSFENRNSMDINLNVSGQTELEVLKMLSKKTNITIEPRKSSEIKEILLNCGVNNAVKHQVSQNTSCIDMVNNHHSNSNDNGKHRNSISNIVPTETFNRNNQIVNNNVGGNQITTADGSRSKLKTSGVQSHNNNGHIQYSQDSTINNVKCSLKTDKLSSCNVHTTDSNENWRITKNKEVKTYGKYEKHVSDKIKVVCSENLNTSKSMQNSNINQIDHRKTSQIQSKTGSVNGNEIFDHIDKSSIEVVKSTVISQNIAKSAKSTFNHVHTGLNKSTTDQNVQCGYQDFNYHLDNLIDQLQTSGDIGDSDKKRKFNYNLDEHNYSCINNNNNEENTVENPRKNSIYENKDLVGRIWVKSASQLTGENSSLSGKNEAEHHIEAGCSEISNVNVPEPVTQIFTCNQEVSISVPSINKESPAKPSRNSKNRSSSPLSKCENACIDLDGMLVASTSSQSNRNTNIISSESKANGETAPDTISTNQTLPHSALVSSDSIQLIQPFASDAVVNSLNNLFKKPSVVGKNTTVLIGTSLFSTKEVKGLFEKYIKSKNQSNIKLIVGILSAIIDLGNSKQNHETKNKADITLMRKSLTDIFFNVIDSFEEKYFNVLVCLLFLYMFALLSTTCCKLGNSRSGLNALISLLKDNLFHKGHDKHFRVESILTSKTLRRDCLYLIEALSLNLPADGSVQNANKYINDSSNESLKNKGSSFSEAAGKNNLLLHESNSMLVSSLSSSSLPTTSTGSSPSLMPSLNNLTTPERLKGVTECDKSTDMKTTYNNEKPITTICVKPVADRISVAANANVSTGNLIFTTPSKLESTKRTLENNVMESNLQGITLDATTNTSNTPHGSLLTTPIMTSVIEPVSKSNPFLCNSKKDNQVELVENSGVANVPHTISNNNTRNVFHSVVKPSTQYVSSYSDSTELQLLKDQLLQQNNHPINQTSNLDCNNANNYSPVISNNWSTDQHLQLHEQNVYQLNPQNEGTNVITRSDDTRYLPNYTRAVQQLQSNRPELQPPAFMNGNSQQDRLNNNVTQNIINKQQAYSNNGNFDLFGQTRGNMYASDISQPAVLQSQYRQTELPNTTCVLNQQQNLSQILNNGICGQYSEINNFQGNVNITNNVSQQLNVYNVQSGDKSVQTETANFVNHVTRPGNNVNLNAVSQTMTETNNTKSNAGKLPSSNYSNSNHIVYNSNRLNSTLQPNGRNCFPQITSYNTSGTNYNVSATTVAAGNTYDVNPLTGNNISAANIDGMNQLSTTSNFRACSETAILQCAADGCFRLPEVTGSCCYHVYYCGKNCQYNDWPKHCLVCPGNFRR